MENGALSVMISGMIQMLVWCVDNLDLLAQVRVSFNFMFIKYFSLLLF